MNKKATLEQSNGAEWSKKEDKMLIEAFNSGGYSRFYSLCSHKLRGKFTVGECIARFNILEPKVKIRSGFVSRILRRSISSLEERLKTLDSEQIPPTLFTVLEKSTTNGKSTYFMKEGQRKDLKKSDLSTVVFDRDRDCSYGGERSRDGGGGSRRYDLIGGMEEVGRFVKQWNKDGFKEQRNRAMEEEESYGAERSRDGGDGSRRYDLIGSREEVARFVELWIKDWFKEQRNRAMEEEEESDGGGSRFYDLIGSREEVARFVELWIKDGLKEQRSSTY